jgi:signal transducing adaptor molecule
LILIPFFHVVKATDETLTSENWEINLNLCDKVQDEGEQGSVLGSHHPSSRSCPLNLLAIFPSARDVIAAILKRLAHRNPNVQLYSFILVESLSKNCGKELHQEIASRAFTQALERLITDRVRISLLMYLPFCEAFDWAYPLRLFIV